MRAIASIPRPNIIFRRRIFMIGNRYGGTSLDVDDKVPVECLEIRGSQVCIPGHGYSRIDYLYEFISFDYT